jgi:hypothetical protein
VPGDIAAELERLKARKAEIAEEMRYTRDQEKKADLRDRLAVIQMQIDTLERFYVRRR